MKRQIGALVVDVAPPEKPKFKGPLILVHGLWSGSWCWSSWATRLSNLGWEVWSVNHRGRAENNAQGIIRDLTFQQCVEDLREIIRAAGPGSVLAGHGFGGITALKAAEGEQLSALTLVSPPFYGNEPEASGRTLYLLRLKYFFPVLLRLPVSIKEADFSRHWLSALPKDRHKNILRGLVPESSDLVRKLFKPEPDLQQTSPVCPTLVLAGRDDRVISIEAVRQWARVGNVELKEYPGRGHWMLDEEGWEEVVNDLHRWAVQKLGESILLAEFPARN